jgi:hypothetical protein
VSAKNNSIYVYIYKDAHEVVRYVGRGTLLRAQDHGDLDENPEFRQAVERHGNLVPIVCVLDNPGQAEAVEGALIHVLTSYRWAELTNRRLDTYRFAPLGVPADLWVRGTEDTLSPADIAKATGGPFLAVYVGHEDLKDPVRGKVDPVDPDPASVADRTLGSWAFGSCVEHWRSGEAPKALLAISGTTKRRYVAASIDLRNFDFGALTSAKKMINFPSTEFQNGVSANGNLDGFDLRGRLVSDITFGRPPETRRWFDSSGREHTLSPFQPNYVRPEAGELGPNNHN